MMTMNRRLAHDIQALERTPLTTHGIHYRHDEQNMFVGHALIVGPLDTPYFGGLYFFDFEFPAEYPHTPPKVTLMTRAPRVRFHPNLHENGKVCLSVLNTWQGNQWSSSLTISSVLLALFTLFDAQPLLHEPFCTTDNRDFDKYTRYVHYKNLEFAVHATSAHFTADYIAANRHLLLEQNRAYSAKENEMEHLMVYGIGGVVYKYKEVYRRLLLL
jgi:ubiquitin-protein ligase